MKQLFHFFIAGLLAIAIPVASLAEGTKEVSKNGDTLTALYYATPTTNNIGSFFNCPESHRLSFRIKDFTKERVYMGFEWYQGGYVRDVYCRIKRKSDDAVVFGPYKLPSNGDADSRGYISSFSRALAGPDIAGTKPTGYTPLSVGLTTNGDFYIEYYRSTNAGVSMSTSVTRSRMLADWWDVSVADTSNIAAPTVIPGRVYCKKWGMAIASGNTGGTIFGSSVGTYYALTKDSVLMRLQMIEGFRPIVFDLVMNFDGAGSTGIWKDDRKSRTQGLTSPSFTNGYKVFLNYPDFSLNDDVIIGSVPAAPTLLNPNITGCGAPYRIRIRANSNGDYSFVLDLNGTPGYQPGTVDRLVEVGYSTSGIVAYNWDGRDGLGNLVASGSTFPIITMMRKGRINWPIYDAELNFGGIRIEGIAPVTTGFNRLYWDDSDVSLMTNSGACDDDGAQTTGVGYDSSINGMPSPAHFWDGPVAGGGGQTTNSLCDDFGNIRVINTWTFGYETSQTQLATLTCTSFTSKVWQDADASAAGTYFNVFTTGEVGTNGGALYAILVDQNSGEVIESVPVSASGDFTLNKVPLNTPNLVIRLSTIPGVETAFAPYKSIPNNWTATSPDTALFASGFGPINLAIEFGIQQRPIATDGSYPNRFNPFGLTYVNIPSTLFTGTDPDAGGRITTFNFTGYPANIDNFYINGVVYTAATWPAGGVQVVAVGNALPAGVIKVDPAAGFLGNTNIPYTVTDKAGTTSIGPNNVNVSFAGVLPVRLISFNGSLNNGVAKLNWLVASQAGTARYFVERKAENSNQWNEIGSVKAINQAGNISYNFDDVNPLTGVGYYRLRIVDWDGSFQYSTIVKIAKNIDYSFNVTVYPNPVKEKLSIAITTEKQDKVSIALFDNTGKLVMVKKIDLQVGNNTIILDEIATFAKGLYMIRVSNEQGTLASTKVLKD